MRTHLLVAAAAAMMVAGCEQGIPPEALALSQVSVEKRQLQTRYFDTLDEARMLSASMGVLQDLGFTLEESESDLGVLLGSKDRDAVETRQVVASIVMAALLGAYIPYDKTQKIRVSVITRPLEQDGRGRTAVRVTFQRLVWNTEGQISRIESLNEPDLYRGFFDKLSQSVFLEANEI